jgi:transcriptional regulator of acetoin/glycerol metabolism
MTTSTDPAEKIARATELRREAEAIEAEAIREALEACNWRVQPAAAALGIPYTSLIQILKGRHKDIGDQVEEMRQKIGGVRRPSITAK